MLVEQVRQGVVGEGRLFVLVLDGVGKALLDGLDRHFFAFGVGHAL